MNDETLIELLARHALNKEQFANYLIKEYGISALDDLYKYTRLAILDEEDITSNAAVNRIAKAIKDNAIPNYTASLSSITSELDMFGVASAVFTINTLKEFAPINLRTPAKQKVIDYIAKAVMSLESGTSTITGTWQEFEQGNIDAVEKQIIAQIRTAKIRGYSAQETINRIKATTQGVSRNAIERMVRTGTAHYSQQANIYVRDDNMDALESGREVPLTVWDSRRSLICTGLEANYGAKGKVSHGWPIGKSPVGYPPYHWGCRTQILYLPESVELEGTRPAIIGKRGKEAMESFARRKDNGAVKYSGRKDKALEADQISVDSDMTKFIINQPVFYQNQLLGTTRAEALRRGEIDLSQITTKTLKPRSLAELGLE